jgi:addiction module RelE/StbE family toxin
MIYKVITTKRAIADMVKIHLYIANELHAPQAADNLINDIEQQIIELKQMPKKYALVLDERLARQGIRKIPVNNHLVFYQVDELTQTVTVVRVLYGSRDWINSL